MKKVTAVIEKSSEGLYSVYANGLKQVALNGQGDSVEEAIEDMSSALDEIIDLYMEERMQLPDELLEDIEFEYKYDIPSLFNFFDMINVSAFSKQIGINPSLMRQYKNGIAFASRKQVEKIRTGIKNLGLQLNGVEL